MMPLCIRCRGKGLCGRPCPIITRMKIYSEQISKIKEDFSGSTPSVFVGHYGYPNINIGLLSPPSINEEAWKLDAPEFWYLQKYQIEKIVEARSQLVNPRNKINIKFGNENILEIAQEVSMAKKPVDIEYILKKKPLPRIFLDLRAAPIGAPALLKEAKPEENVKIGRNVDKIVNDEIKAETSINELYRKGIEVNQITKILSVGLLGLKSQKKLVPTRWSITAIDDVISKKLIQRIRNFPIVSEFLLFRNEYLGNHFEILLMPKEWNFEVIEGKQPGSCWNISGNQVYIYADWERYWGRKDYADNVTGAYYSDRLGVCEYLMKIKRQAAVLIVREVKPEYMLPLGVWVNRETVRNAFKNKPERFSSLETALKRIFKKVKLPAEKVIASSQLLKEIRNQRKIIEFIS